MTVFDNVRKAITSGDHKSGPMKSVSELMLTDNTNDLSECTIPLTWYKPLAWVTADRVLVDFKTMLGGLMSGGFETLYATTVATIGFLSSAEGQVVQEKAYKDLVANYTSVVEAFQHAVDEEKSPYVIALVREALRFYPPLKLLPPRQTFKEFEYQGARIPKGILIYVNAQAINRGE